MTTNLTETDDSYNDPIVALIRLMYCLGALEEVHEVLTEFAAFPIGDTDTHKMAANLGALIKMVRWE